MRRIPALMVVTVLGACSGTDAPDASAGVDAPPPPTLSLFSPDELGTVELPVSCSDAAAAGMEHGLALLHHMAYSSADLVFEGVLEEDPSCAMGYWGRAMTIIHPLWPDVPSATQLDQGAAFVEQALALEPETDRERGYVDAVGAYFGAPQRTEPERLALLHAAWTDVHERFPEDWEAASFFAMTGLANGVGLPRESAGALMESLMTLVPDHPAAQHYIIHSYAGSPLASRALEVARTYGRLAPQVPHALHMPTHIHTDLGLWAESIDLNERSADAALERGPLIDGLDVSYPHPMAYLVYAYLQTGQDAEAMAVRDRALSVEGPFSELNLTTFAAHLVEMPVRYALERHAWEEATQLELRPAPGFPWTDEYTQYDAATYFARAIGHARTGDAAAARESLVKLTESLERSTTPFLVDYAPTLSGAAEAWVEYAEGEIDSAIVRMTAAAERGARWLVDDLLPAREFLADMYFELGRYDEAMAAYEAVLESKPNRFNSLCGAARSAELGGRQDKARSHYQTLIDVAHPSSSRECLSTGRAFLATG